MPGWSTILRNSRKALVENRLEQAETMVFQAIALNQEHVLAGITHLELLKAMGDKASLTKFSDIYHSRWPEAVLFKLALAESKLEGGDEASAVNLLHQCVASDAAGQISTRWWGKEHAFKPLWPENLETGVTVGVPAVVAGRLGWNRLPAPASADSPTKNTKPSAGNVEMGRRSAHSQASRQNNPSQAVKPPEKLKSETPLMSSDWLKDAEADFDKLARRMKARDLVKSDGRFPIYVIFSTKKGICDQFGEHSLSVIDSELKKLAEIVRGRAGWGSMIFYPDDIECTGKLGLATVASADPWKLKLALQDLDAALAKKGGRIGALLIVGGPKIVPYHQ